MYVIVCTVHTCTYIYIHTEREREREPKYIYIYIYTVGAEHLESMRYIKLIYVYNTLYNILEAIQKIEKPNSDLYVC